MADNNNDSASAPSERRPRLTLRDHLDHIRTEQETRDNPSGHDQSHSSPLTYHASLTDRGFRRRSAELSPGTRLSPRSRTNSPSSRHMRFSADLERPHRRAPSPLGPPRSPRAPLYPENELYTIESNVPDPGSSQRWPAEQESATEASTSRLGRISGSARNSLAGDIGESRISLTRPRQRYDHETDKAPVTAAESNETLLRYRDWAMRQKDKQMRWASRPLERIRTTSTELYQRYIIEGLFRIRPVPPSVDGRHIPVQPGLARRAPLDDERTGSPYRSNFIRSSRYTVWDFLPRQLFFQFSKLANFYFLIIGILQMVPGLSPTGSYTTIAPLLVFVTLSMGKEGYDDYRRYRLDKTENRSTTWVLDPDGTIKTGRGERKGNSKNSNTVELDSVGASSPGRELWVKVQWQDVRVGDIVRLRRNENVPADMVLLRASGPNGVAYIETMALDGETNLKSKQVSTSLAKRSADMATLSSYGVEVVSEDPNLDLYSYEGRVTVAGETSPLTAQQVVYRGSTLRNTTEAVGLVINSGEECKIRMNANKNARAKAPRMQSIVNRIVLMLVFCVIMLSGGCTLGYYLWHSRYEIHATYLNNHFPPAKEIVFGFIIEFNTLIPLSLYISLEIVKLGQLFLLSDIEMYDPVSNTPMVANTTTILEDLGQVNYVFSDKTGTLTENIMRFRKFSVAGTAWLHDMDIQREAEASERKKKRKAAVRRRPQSPARKQSAKLARKDDPAQDDGLEQGTTKAPPRRSQSVSQWKSTVRPGHAQPELKTEDMIRYLRQKPNTPFSRKARQLILCLALCHTCIPEKNKDGDIEFQAASPDELALVEAAKDLGYVLVDREAQSITLQFWDFDGTQILEKYEVTDVIEFSSKRKRMSIIIRMPDGGLCIFSKGADNVILPRLRQRNLAQQVASAVERTASMRKSMEQEKAFRRQSTHSVRRESVSLARAASVASMAQAKWDSMRRESMRHSTHVPRRSLVLDEVNSWLSEREDLDEPSGHDDAYQSPIRSAGVRASREFAQLGDADGLVDESLATDDARVFQRCFQHINDFASEGLRTLIYAYRYLDEKDYREWKKTYHEATTSLVDRQERTEAAAELIEQNFELAGATAIEDKLQQGVPETIDKLRRANIKVWMLTGDKRETAITIAHSARICKPYSELYVLDVAEGDLHGKISSTLSDIGRGMIPHSVLVVDGQTLSVVEADEMLKILFFDLVARVDSVICCRAAPAQKATLVEHVRDHVPGSLTLAIGDGANDIAMIQSSHVGIGISGREGLQAARISDFSIAQFRFLQRLLFVHGRWNYIRTAKYILGTFWKEIVFFLVQAQYQRYNGYTGTSLYEPTSLTVFNTLFTSLPVILLGIFEKDLHAETLLAVPELYTYGQKNKGFSFRKYLVWMFMAAAEAVIIFHVIYEVYVHALFTVDTTLFAMGACAFTVCVIYINLKMLVIELHHRTVISFLGLFISVSGWFVWNIFLSAIYAVQPGPYLVRHAFLRNFGRNSVWWLTGIGALAAVLVFEVCVKTAQRMFRPSDQQLMQEIEHFRGVLGLMTEHAAERGEGDGGLFAGAGPEGQWSQKQGDADSVKTVDSSPSVEMARWQWDGVHNTGDGSRKAANAVGKRTSRVTVEEYHPPPFTPPAEEREMDFGAGPQAGPKMSKPAGTASKGWITAMSRAASKDATFTLSPLEVTGPSSPSGQMTHPGKSST